MESNELNSQKVLSRCNALRNGESDLAVVGNQSVDSPYTIAKAVMVNLEPSQSSNVTLKSVRYFSPRKLGL